MVKRPRCGQLAQSKGMMGFSDVPPTRKAQGAQVPIPAPAFLVFCLGFRNLNCKMKQIIMPSLVWRTKQPAGLWTRLERLGLHVILTVCREWVRQDSKCGAGPALRPGKGKSSGALPSRSCSPFGLAELGGRRL